MSQRSPPPKIQTKMASDGSTGRSLNDYHIYEEIGKGKQSIVYKGRRKKSIEYVAIKSVDKSQRERLMNEVRCFLSPRFAQYPFITIFSYLFFAACLIPTFSRFIRGTKLTITCG
jgi:predicted Ser/Thr protein kinase